MVRVTDTHTTHHCPRARGSEGPCTKGGMYCTNHCRTCERHPEIAYLKTDPCPKCVATVQVVETKAFKKRDAERDPVGDMKRRKVEAVEAAKAVKDAAKEAAREARVKGKGKATTVEANVEDVHKDVEEDFEENLEEHPEEDFEEYVEEDFEKDFEEGVEEESEENVEEESEEYVEEEFEESEEDVV
ncbi:hypothetical protein D6D10_05192 [Aureobasidium pullulans]|uniref:Uncharacterized protein n=1 Tax=Aureobasidium pullulans TaxID=5580 RepID=A0A4S9EWS4_AURPU|nr:hypothetical protein D6D10_05192 [Aureobasidium pullulans]